MDKLIFQIMTVKLFICQIVVIFGKGDNEMAIESITKKGFDLNSSKSYFAFRLMAMPFQVKSFFRNGLNGHFFITFAKYYNYLTNK